jgi:hypothetical protein
MLKYRGELSMKYLNYLYIALSLLVMQSSHDMFGALAKKTVTAAKPKAGSQTASYLSTLGNTRQEAYAKIKKVLTAPQVDKQTGQIIKDGPNMEIEPQVFAPIVDQVIESELKHPGYYAFYQGSAKEGFITHLLRTYIHQIENGWTRDDYMIVRSPEAYYKKPAKSAADYIKQNKPYILQQFIAPDGSTDPNCIFAATAGCSQLDFVQFPVKNTGDWRNHLLSTSPSFIAGVDETPYELRELYDEDRAAWESSFYYFTSGLSWSTFRRLYTILVADLKRYVPSLFANKPIDMQIRKYIAVKLVSVDKLLFPLDPAQTKYIKEGSVQEWYSKKAGMVFQFLIPANIVDDVVYLSWQNGPLWQRKIGGFEGGWDNSIGAYTKVSPILDQMKTNPQSLGRAIHLFQTRIILKDEKYFNDPKSPIKINLIHSLQPSLFKSIEDSLRSIARVVVEYKQAEKKGTLVKWFEQTDIANSVRAEELKLAELLASQSEDDQIKAMNILYYFAATGVDVQRAKQVAGKYNNSNNLDLKRLSDAILSL